MSQITEKQRKWLDLIRLASYRSRGLRGEHADFVPPRHVRVFEREGWVDRVIPHNPAHKERLVITDAGLAALGMESSP